MVESSSCQVYIARLAQSGVDAPIATVLENTLGGTVVWARAEVGRYNGTLVGAFPFGKTVIPTPYKDDLQESQVGHRLFSPNDDTIQLQQCDVSGLFSGSGAVEFDGFAEPVVVEVRVYL